MSYQESYINDSWDTSEPDGKQNDNSFCFFGGDGSSFFDYPALYSHTQFVDGTDQFIFRFHNGFGALVYTDPNQMCYSYDAPWTLTLIYFYDDYSDYWESYDPAYYTNGPRREEQDIIDLLDEIASFK